MKKLLLALIITFLFILPLYSQEENKEDIYVINSFVFNIDGYTRPYALVYHGELIAGEEIKGFANLEKYIKDKTQQLYNQRVLDSVSIDYSLGENDDDGRYPVDLVINVKDTWNIVAIPRPQYSSNTGFDLTIKARDYNFLGSMSALRIDLGYIYDIDKQTYFFLMLDSDVPFTALNLNWNINFDHDFYYRPDLDLPYYYKNVSGFHVELPVSFTVITLGFNESFIYNQENEERYRGQGRFQEGLYMSSNPFVNWKIPTNLEVGEYGELVYRPRLSAVFNHAVSEPLHDHLIGPFLTFGHSLGFGKIDWIGNFQKGYSANITNNYTYNFNHSKNDIEPLEAYLGVSGTGHFVFTEFLGLSSRIMYRQWFLDNYSTEAANVMRGILNKDVSADFMVSLNLDITARVLKFQPSLWLEKPKLRVFNFELHFSPFVDTAIYRNTVNEILYSEESFYHKNVLFSGGMEFVVFPEFFRSLYLRISTGYNFNTFLTKSNYEIFIGTDFHY